MLNSLLPLITLSLLTACQAQGQLELQGPEGQPQPQDTGFSFELDSDDRVDIAVKAAASCVGSACDGQDAISMGCIGEKTLATERLGEVSYALKYSTVCDTVWMRGWRHTSPGYLNLRAWREADWTKQSITDTAANIGDKKDSPMLYCPSGSCQAMGCTRDGLGGDWTCTAWY